MVSRLLGANHYDYLDQFWLMPIWPFRTHFCEIYNFIQEN